MTKTIHWSVACLPQVGQTFNGDNLPDDDGRSMPGYWTVESISFEEWAFQLGDEVTMCCLVTLSN